MYPAMQNLRGTAGTPFSLKRLFLTERWQTIYPSGNEGISLWRIAEILVVCEGCAREHLEHFMKMIFAIVFT